MSHECILFYFFFLFHYNLAQLSTFHIVLTCMQKQKNFNLHPKKYKIMNQKKKKNLKRGKLKLHGNFFTKTITLKKMKVTEK